MWALALPVVIAGGLSALYLLPERGEMAESSASMELPLDLAGGWRGVKRQESDKERSVLAADTKFAKADYSNPQAFPLPLHVSLVLSGHDLNNSIHRPERCLPAQGHYMLEGSDAELELKGGVKVPFRRLTSRQNLTLGNGKTITINSIHYYIFIGHGRLTHSHLKRTLVDMADRLLYGRDQRWAYLQVSSWYGEAGELSALSPENPYLLGEVTEKDADRALQGFIGEMLPGIVGKDVLEGK